MICFAATVLAVGVEPAQESDDGLVDLVIGLLADSDKDVRSLALEQVRTEAPGEAATRKFAAQLPKLSADAQVGLLGALADRGDVAARPAVLQLSAGSKQSEVRIAAISALGELGETADCELLIDSLADGTPSEQAAAKNSLVRLRGDAASAAIAERMTAAAPKLRAVLIDILQARRAVSTIPAILSAAVADDPVVRAAAMKALAQLAGAQHVAAMVRGVLKAETGAERAAAEKAVMFVCHRTADPERQAEPLLAVMDSMDHADRVALLPTLGRVGGPQALEVVETALADADPALHETGLRALCHWPDASVAARLLALARSEKQAEHRIMALRAAIRVAPLRDDRTDAERLELLKQALEMATRDEERLLAIQRARAIRTPETLRLVVTFLDQPDFAQAACETIVELAHHRGLREPNKAEFHQALDKVIATSRDAVVVDRAERYKQGQTWARPIATK